jgi:ATP-dependent DNA helicase RecG
VLEELRLLRQGRPTNAAVLLFGYEAQRFLSCARIECAQRDGTGKTIESLVCDGTVWEAVDLAMYFVLSRLKLPAEAAREAIVNAAAHRDYSVSGGIEVRVFADRLEVRNPGSLPGNPLLAQALYLTGYRETIGTRTDGMSAICRKAGLPEPEFSQADGFAVILRVKREQESAPPAAPGVDPALLALVRLLGKAGALGNADILKGLGLRDRADLHKRYLKPALAAGLIEPTIPEKPTSRLQKYRLTTKGSALLGS